MTGPFATIERGVSAGRAIGAVLAALAIAGLAAPAAPAAAESISSGNDKFKVTISGELNRAFLFAVDGDESDVFFVDTENRPTRVRLEGVGRFDRDIAVHAVIEAGLLSNPTSEIKIGQAAVGAIEITARNLEFYLDHRRFGRLSFGRGETASDGTSEVDLSGTEAAGYSLVSEFAGGIQFIGAGNPQINEVFNNMDGFGRDDRARYDTPSFNGFRGSISRFEEGDGWDFAGRYNGKVGAFDLAAALAIGDTDLFTQANGSGSVLHRKTGLNLTIAAGGQSGNNAAGDDPFFGYAKLGYKSRMTSYGTTAVAADFGYAVDINATDDQFVSLGLLAVQNFNQISTKLYASIRIHLYENNGVEADEIAGLMIGARVSF